MFYILGLINYMQICSSHLVEGRRTMNFPLIKIRFSGCISGKGDEIIKDAN